MVYLLLIESLTDNSIISTFVYFPIPLHRIYRRSNMSAHVLLNLLNELGKKDKMRGFSATSLIHSITLEHKC